MPSKRIKCETTAIYHIITRVTGREFLLDAEVKDGMRKDLGKVAGYSGVEVLTYTIMDNHVHLLARIAGKCTADEKEILRRYQIMYGWKKTRGLARRWKHLRETKQMHLLHKEHQRERRRMDDLSEFMKTLKQLWSQHYNKKTRRKGTLWEGTFHSLLVDPEDTTFVGAYIDMNAVRAKIVESPEEYPWCGFAEAMGKSRRVIDNLDLRQGLMDMYRMPSDQALGKRLALEHLNRFFRAKKDLEDLPAEYWDKNGMLIHGGDLPISLFLRCRIGYFTRGLIIGTKHFVNQAFHDFREFFSSKRKTGARKIRGCRELSDLIYTARDLRKNVICFPQAP